MNPLTTLLTFVAAVPTAVQAPAVPAPQGSTGFAHVLSRALPSSIASTTEEETAQDAETTDTHPEGAQDAKTPRRHAGTATLPSREDAAQPESAPQLPPGEAPQADLALEGVETEPDGVELEGTGTELEGNTVAAHAAGEAPADDPPAQQPEKEGQPRRQPIPQPPAGWEPASQSAGEAETLPSETPDTGLVLEAEPAPQTGGEPGIEVFTRPRDSARTHDTVQNDPAPIKDTVRTSEVLAEPMVSAAAASTGAKLAQSERVAAQGYPMPGNPHQAHPAPAATAVQSASAQAPSVPPVAVPVAVASPAQAPPSSPAAPFAATAQSLNTQLVGPVHQMLSGGAGSKTLILNVAPEHLGPVTVRANFTAEGVRIELFAPQDAGREALRGMLGDLRRDLAGLGMSTGTSSLSVSDSEAPAQNSPQSQQRGTDQQPGSAGRQADQHTDQRARGRPTDQGTHQNPTNDVQRSNHLRPHTPGEHLDLFA